LINNCNKIKISVLIVIAHYLRNIFSGLALVFPCITWL